MLLIGALISCAILGLLGQPVKNSENSTSVSHPLESSVRKPPLIQPNGNGVEDEDAEVRQVPRKERVKNPLTCHCKSNPTSRLQLQGVWTDMQCSQDHLQGSAGPQPQAQPLASSVFIAHGVIDSTGHLTSSQPPDAFTVEKLGVGQYSVNIPSNLQRNEVPTVLVTAWSRRHRYPAQPGTGAERPMAALIQHVTRRHFRYVIVTSGHRVLDSSCSIVVVWG